MSPSIIGHYSALSGFVSLISGAYAAGINTPSTPSPSGSIQPSYDTSTAVDPSTWSHISDPTYGGMMPPTISWDQLSGGYGTFSDSPTVSSTITDPSQTSLLPSAAACLSSWAEYDRGWTTYGSNTTFPPQTTVSETSVKNPTKVSFSTLCDHIPRAPPGVSEYLMQNTTITQKPGSIGPATTNTVPAPTCTVAADQCLRAGENWRSGNSSSADSRFPVLGPCQNSQNCNACQIRGQSVELMYWPSNADAVNLCGAGNGSVPTPTAAGNGPSTTVIGSLTLTSPSVYLSFGYLIALSKTQDMPACGQPTSNIVVSMLPESLSSIRTEMRTGPDGSQSTTTATEKINFADFTTARKEAYQGMARCWTEPAKGNLCTAIYDDYRPHLVIPDSVRTLVPFWKNCDPCLEGVLDPPIPLTAADNLLPPKGKAAVVVDPQPTGAGTTASPSLAADPRILPAAVPKADGGSTKTNKNQPTDKAPPKQASEPVFKEYTDLAPAPASGGSVSFRHTYVSGPPPKSAFEGAHQNGATLVNNDDPSATTISDPDTEVHSGKTEAGQANVPTDSESGDPKDQPDISDGSTQHSDGSTEHSDGSTEHSYGSTEHSDHSGSTPANPAEDQQKPRPGEAESGTTDGRTSSDGDAVVDDPESQDGKSSSTNAEEAAALDTSETDPSVGSRSAEAPTPRPYHVDHNNNNNEEGGTTTIRTATTAPLRGQQQQQQQKQAAEDSSPAATTAAEAAAAAVSGSGSNAAGDPNSLSATSPGQVSGSASGTYSGNAAATPSRSSDTGSGSASSTPSSDDMESKASRSDKMPRIFAVFKVFKIFKILGVLAD